MTAKLETPAKLGRDRVVFVRSRGGPGRLFHSLALCALGMVIAASLWVPRVASAGAALGIETKLAPNDPAPGDELGNAVALYGDTALIGAVDKACQAGSICGAAYVFVRSGGTWVAQAKLTASDAGSGDAFGSSVAL